MAIEKTSELEEIVLKYRDGAIVSRSRADRTKVIDGSEVIYEVCEWREIDEAELSTLVAAGIVQATDKIAELEADLATEKVKVARLQSEVDAAKAAKDTPAPEAGSVKIV